LKDLKKANVLHIDVRERWEIDRFGKIPQSINIPLGELMEALQMDPTDFKEQYNQKMPSKSDPVVFSCLAGTRSKQALGFAMSLGFSRDTSQPAVNLLHYRGLTLTLGHIQRGALMVKAWSPLTTTPNGETTRCCKPTDLQVKNRCLLKLGDTFKKEKEL
ncbi:hypothetical protein EK904_008688, partial [Melospiza melodia maxima]